METKLEVINEQEVLGKQFRIYGTMENPVFLAKDVAEWIEYAWANAKHDHRDVSRMIKTVDEDEKLRGTIFLSGQDRDAWFLTEDGLYEVLMQSRKPIAKQFKKKVKEILKTIRKHGAYMTPDTLQQVLADPRSMAQLLLNLADEQEKNRRLTAQIETIQPEAEAYKNVLKTVSGTMSLGHFLEEHGCNDLHSRLVYRYLEEDGVISGARHRPRQEFIDAHIFAFQVREYQKEDGTYQSQQREFRVFPDDSALRLAEVYVPTCLETRKAEKELKAAENEYQKAVNKVNRNKTDKNMQAMQEAYSEMQLSQAILDEAKANRCTAIWSLLDDAKENRPHLRLIS